MGGVRQVAALGLLLAVGVSSRLARAGIATSGPPQESVVGPSRLGIESVWTTFDLPGQNGGLQKGYFFGYAARGDYRVNHRVSLRLEVPVYTVHLDGLSTHTGLGDMELRMRALLLDSHDWRIYAGIADQLPTGATSTGLGQGATQLTPYVTAGYRYKHLIVYGLVGEALTIRPPKAATLPDWVDPSTDDEVRYTLGAVYEFSELFYANAIVTGITELLPSVLGTSLCTGGASLGLQPSDEWKIVAGLQLPIAGEHRYESKVLLSLYYFFQ
jgi:hypothetical protein